MSNHSNLLRTFDELLWVIRRAGLNVSTSQAIDALRAIETVGLEDREALRHALSIVLVQRRADLVRFEQAFDQFFQPDSPHARDLMTRLSRLGFESQALSTLQQVLDAMIEGGAGGDIAVLLELLGGGTTLSSRLMRSDIERSLTGLNSALQVGFFSQKVLERVGSVRAGQQLARLRKELVDALGEEGERLADALVKELAQARSEVRAFVEEKLRRRLSRNDDPNLTGSSREATFFTLDPAQLDETRRAVRTLGERLRGAARVRERHALHGRVDPAATLRRAMRTGGVPVQLVRRKHRRDRPKLWVFCDISDSVRTAASFMLEFVAITQELFDRTRTFVFVNELGESTALFESEPVDVAIGKAFSGAIVDVHHNSSYGRVLRQLEERHSRDLDRRCTVVILGDGRTNYQPAEAEILGKIRDKVGSLLWLCPEPMSSWGTGDSAMPLYAKYVTAVLPASTASELEVAARAILVRRG
ncbi:MAG: VWA domain-containing protein [Polyangiaceae bacterium]